MTLFVWVYLDYLIVSGYGFIAQFVSDYCFIGAVLLVWFLVIVFCLQLVCCCLLFS